MRLRVDLAIILIVVSFLTQPVLAQTAYDPVRFTVDAFVINGDNPIGDKAYKVLAPYIGEQSGLEGLSAAADDLEQAIINAGFSFHRVSLPPQSLTDGRVEFNIVSFTIGQVTIEGNQHFDQQNIENSLPELRAGTTPNTSELSRSLRIANNHASKSTSLRFKEGEGEDTIDALITVSDKNPQLYFLTLDNSGSADSEEYRTTFGYQHGNLFNKDHAMTLTLTVAPADPDATTQIGFNYHLPLYRHGATVDFLFSDSEINSGVVGEDMAISGKGSVLGAAYIRPILSDSRLNHQWSAGVQRKLFENQIEISGSQVEADVLSFPLELGYGFSYPLQDGAISGSLSYAMNIDSGSHNTVEDYQAVRIGADNKWSLMRYQLAYDHVFADDWLFHTGLSGQQSDDLLISGEQFGVGGSSTLRGFEERSITGDQGYQLSLEVWTPAYSNMRYLVFIDSAMVELNNGDSYDLSSAGLGLRWTWKQQMSLALDYGVINQGGGPDVTINQDGDDRFHLNLIYRF